MQHLVLNVPITVQTLNEALAWLDERLHSASRGYVSTCTVYTLMVAQDQPDVMQALKDAAMVTADGMPLVWMQRAAGFRTAGRVYGPDLFLGLCARTRTQNVRHFFLGGTPGVAEKLADTLKTSYPELSIAGYYAPAVSETVPEVDLKLVETLNAARADVIWVGLGSPKQDLWMHTYRPTLNATLLIGVGAAFDFIAGTKKQAPQWMRHGGLEWLFRLMTEPNRLWRRYLIYNTRFLYAIFWNWLKTSHRAPSRN